uniref:Cis-kolav-3,13e-dienol synthase n=1 Tax=Marchantia polymorpha TaxID=3197 RepID=A0A8U0D9P7_MARPO|nr:cis-kolav-3,13e-dienol synthase [Marchantia polymorpha]
MAVHTTNDSASRVPKWRNYAHRIHSSATEVKELETTDNKSSANSSTARPNDTHMQAWIEEIRGLLRSMFEKGETSDSPYDTAWVSLIPAVDGSQGPQFPNTLKWIARNQLEDGSWGDVDFFSIQNNVLCTLMCIIALKSWNTGLDSVEKGLRFLRKSMALLEDETHEKLVGFELVFPSILDHAKNLDLDLPYNLPVIDKLRAAREEKLRKIPLHLIYTTPTSVTYSLEGIRDVVDWEQISQQQQQTDGSFGCSPAATACAYLHTGNESCFRYLTSIPQLCDGAAPPFYPSDIFQRLWAVDRLQRLGIARHFESEIKASLDYVYEHFSSRVGCSWASTCNVTDLDDSAMAFRLLRLHGYDVSSDCFQHFRDSGEWCTYPGEINRGVSSTFNFYRAAQTCFPEECLLMEGAEWARRFLLDKHTQNLCRDKWVISKGLHAEVGSALSNPWYEHLPRLEHRSYLDQYGPQHVWISKVLYRMHSFTNSVFLKLAKADFNLCQSKHQEELQVLLRWNEERGFNSIRTREKQMVYCFYVAVCILPAPEQSMARTVWAKLAMLNVLIDDFFDSPSESYTDKVQFLEAFRSRNPNLMDGTGGEAKLFFESIYNTITEIAAEGSLFQGRDISHHVYNIWLRLVENQFKEAEWKHLNYEPSLEEYMSVSEVGISFEAMTPTQFFMGEKISPAMVDSPHTKRLMHLANVVARLSNDIRTYQREESENKPNWVSISKRNGLTESEIIEEARKVMDEHMKQLVKETYSPSKSHPLLPRSARQLYFDTVRAIRFAYRTGDALAPHMLDTKQSIDSILFEPVLL